MQFSKQIPDGFRQQCSTWWPSNLYLHQLASNSFKQTEKNNFRETVLVNTGAGVRTDHIQSFPAQISEMMAQLMFFPHS